VLYLAYGRRNSRAAEREAEGAGSAR
jgi:hypothetical protein